MSEPCIKNYVNLFLTIKQQADKSYHYQYRCRMDNGVEVDLLGLIISEPTQITVQLSSVTNANFDITQCLIPCDQTTVTAKVEKKKKTQIVTIVDLDNEKKPEDYNFVIVAKDLHTSQLVVCDPQISNKGKGVH